MKGLLFSVLLCATHAASTLAAGNLVINGGFQTGTLAPWISTGAVTVEQHGTDFAAKLGNSAELNDASITQTIATEAETRYYFSMRVQDVTPDKKYAVAIRVRFGNGGVDYKADLHEYQRHLHRRYLSGAAAAECPGGELSGDGEAFLRSGNPGL